MKEAAAKGVEIDDGKTEHRSARGDRTALSCGADGKDSVTPQPPHVSCSRWSPWSVSSDLWESAIGAKSLAADSLLTASGEAKSRLDALLSGLHSDGPAADNPHSQPRSSAAPPSMARRNSYSELKWLLNNPYGTTLGRHESPASIDAVRTMLHLLPTRKPPQCHSRPPLGPFAHLRSPPQRDSSFHLSPPSLPSAAHPAHSDCATLLPSTPHKPVSSAETASRLAEGTIRALRDLALDEAISLNSALRFWTERWERPVLSWLEAGPNVWLSNPHGYDHQFVGRRVSQIQAVLARRCASIGELQQHLLRAGWQKGVAQWGVLGHGGGQWAAVAGGHGEIMADPGGSGTSNLFIEQDDHDSDSVSFSTMQFLPHHSIVGTVPPPSANPNFNRSHHQRHDDPSSPLQTNIPYYGEASLVVENARGGHILSDNSALVAWSIDAIRLVRNQLYRAGNDVSQLPCHENWPQEVRHFRASIPCEESVCLETTLDDETDDSVTDHTMDLPLWATDDVGVESSDSYNYTERQTTADHTLPLWPVKERSSSTSMRGEISISDLHLMASEVSELLDSMEVQMEIQRNRRLTKLKPAPRIYRQWYIAAVVLPASAYLVYKLMHDDMMGSKIARAISEKVTSFWLERIADPLSSIYRELFTRKGRNHATDRKARQDAIHTLQKMIKSWLDETYPTMSESERMERANAMDMSLIEERKEDSIKRIYELNNIVRMSLIEMQFIKKELMNAMYSMDELMDTNEINIKLASMTPAVMLLYGTRYLFRFFFYALLKIGKSREETYASFRHIILDIERLLVMRDNPPSAPPPPSWGIHAHHHHHHHRHETVNQDKDTTPVDSSSPPKSTRDSDRGTNIVSGYNNNNNNNSKEGCALNSNDLGMLMLQVHECRTILWRNHRRFSRQELRNVSEDLAELVGERGAVSVRQQLQIVSRMCRTYSFLKVVSTGIPSSMLRHV